MTPEEWYSQPSNAAFIREQLNHPIWQAALSVLNQLGYAFMGADTPVSAISGNGEALAGKILGYQKCENNIRSLATDAAPKQEGLQDNYGVRTQADATE